MLSASYISKEIGELLAKSYKDCIGKGVKVTAEMAQAVLKPALHNIVWLKSTPPTRAGTSDIQQIVDLAKLKSTPPTRAGTFYTLDSACKRLA